MGIDRFKKKKSYVVFGLAVVVVFFMLFLFQDGEKSKPGYPIKRLVQYGFQIENRSNEVAKDVEFWTYAPVKQTSTQKFKKLSVSHPYDLTEDEFGNQVIHMKFDFIPPFATKIVSIQAELLMSDVPNPLIIEKNNDFLRAEKHIEVKHDAIKKAASLFSGTAESDVKAIYKWTADHIQGVAYVREDRGALYALQNKSGDCTEYTYLFTAVCRAKGIPARPLGGYIMNENGRLVAENYHNWAEFYLNGAWHVADSQMKVFMERPSRFIAMNIISDPMHNAMGEAQRFRFTGKNIHVKVR